MVDPANEAAAAARETERLNAEIPNAVKAGQPIGECPGCGERFGYGAHTGADVSNMDSCPECGSRDWHKWGYRHNGEAIRRDEAWDRYDAPPSIQSENRGNDRSQDAGAERTADTEIIPRDELEQTGENEHGPSYRCPRCGFEWVTEHCDCPECGWAGMCQEGWG